MIEDNVNFLFSRGEKLKAKISVILMLIVGFNFQLLGGSANAVKVSAVNDMISGTLSIREIIAKYGINGFGQPGGTDKDTWHSYVDSYEYLLEPFKNKNCNLLEIGVDTGGSALIWHDYLPKSRLFLIDIQDKRVKIPAIMDSERCVFTEMDAYNLNAIAEMKKKCPDGFDIIIDDGPHTLESQIFVVQFYARFLKKGGLLVIEDIQDPAHIDELRKYVRGMKVEVVDLRENKNRYDDILFIVRNNA